MSPSEMMNKSHNNISEINQKQDKRKNEINQGDRNHNPSTSKSLIAIL
jgi:hypothetical protein